MRVRPILSLLCLLALLPLITYIPAVGQVTTGTHSNSVATGIENDTNILPDSDSGYSYWFPYIDPNPQPNPDRFYSHIAANSIITSTVYVDSNFNGMRDTGELTATVEPSLDPVILFNTVLSGSVRLVSDYPLQTYVHYWSAEPGPYDEQRYQYASALLGKRFVVPISDPNGTVHIVATANNTTVHLPTGSVHLNAGQHLATNAVAAEVITSDRPIGVTLIIFNRTNKDSTAAVSLVPADQGGTEFWVPPKIDLNATILSDDRRLVLAYRDGSIETRPMPADATLVTTTQPAIVYWFLDVNTDDPASSQDRRYLELWALSSIDRLGTQYANGGYLLSSHDNNLIRLDSDYDGVYEQELNLDAGEMYPSSYVRRSGPHYGLSYINLGQAQSTYPVLAWQIHAGAWYGTDDHISGTEQRSFNCTVPYFSQRDPRWIDHPLRTNGVCSADCNTIGKCGCTLTSSAMVFKYYGADLNPATLSDCMGIRACPFYWGTGAACSENKAQWVGRHTFSWSRLEQELSQSRHPVVLGMHKGINTHWVVVLSGSGSNPASYIIHDPWPISGSDMRLDVYSSRGWYFDWLSVYAGQPACGSLPAATANLVGAPASHEIATQQTILAMSEAQEIAISSTITGSVRLYRMTAVTMTLQLTATSESGDITEMLIWTDSMSQTIWQPFSAFAYLPISDEIYARFRDTADNTSEMVSDTLHPVASPPTAPFEAFLPLILKQ